MSDFINNYRARAKNQGYADVDNYSDEEILKFLGDDLRQKGITMSQMEESYGADFTNSYYDIINAPEPGREGVLGGVKEFASGFKRGASGLLSSGAALGGLVLDEAGFDSAGDALMEKAAQLRAEAARGGPSISRATDVRWDNINEVARFLAGGLGEATPSVLEAGVSFAAGGGAGMLIAKQAAKKRLNQTLAKLNAPKEIEDVLRAATLQSAAQKGKSVGSNVALAGSSFGMNMGEIYSELHEYSKLNPSDPKYIQEDEAKRLAITYGGLAGGLDFASAGAILNKTLGIGEELSTKYLKRLVSGLPAGVIVEGGTEAAQEFLAIAAEKYAHGDESDLSGEEINRLIDAGVLGALGGAQFTAISAIKGPPKEDDGTSDKKETEKAKEQEVENINERQKKLKNLLNNPSIDEFVPEVGMDVQDSLGLSGTVQQVRGDGLVEIELEDGSIATVGFDTIAPKNRTPEELESVLNENKALAEDGDASAQIEVISANKENENTLQVLEASSPSPPKETGTYIFDKGTKEVPLLLEEELKELEEVHDGLIAAAKSGNIRSYEMNNRAALEKAMGPELTQKWARHLDKLKESGIITESLLPSKVMVDKFGYGTASAGHAKTKADIDVEQKDLATEIDKRKLLIARKSLNKGEKATIRNKTIEKEGAVLPDETQYEVEEIINQGKQEADSYLVKLKGIDEPFNPKDLLGAKKKPAGKGKRKKANDDAAPPPPQPVKKTGLTDLSEIVLKNDNNEAIPEKAIEEAVVEVLTDADGNPTINVSGREELATQLGLKIAPGSTVIEVDPTTGKPVITPVEPKKLQQFIVSNPWVYKGKPALKQQALYLLEKQSESESSTKLRGYHSTDAETIDIFETDPRQTIDGRDIQMGAHFGGRPGTVKKGRKNVVQAELDLKNSLRMPDLNKWDAESVSKWLIDNNVVSSYEIDERLENLSETGGVRENALQGILKEKGYDSIVYENKFEGTKDDDSYIVFNPESINIIDVTDYKESQNQTEIPPQKGKSIQIPDRADGEYDIISAMRDIGPIFRTQPPDGAEFTIDGQATIAAYRDLREALSFGVVRLLRGGIRGMTPDVIGQNLDGTGLPPPEFADSWADATQDQIYQAITDALEQREKAKERVDIENRQLAFEAALYGNEARASNQNATRPLNASDLEEGDKFKVKGRWVYVKELTQHGFVIEHEDFPTTFGKGYQIVLNPAEGVDDTFYADKDLIYAHQYVSDEDSSNYDPFSDPSMYVRYLERKGKAIPTNLLTDNDLGLPIGYFPQEVSDIPGYMDGSSAYAVPERALIAIPTGTVPSTLIGTIELNENLDDKIMPDGTYNPEYFKGLKKQGKKQKKGKASNVLLILQKVEHDNGDKLPIGSVRLMQAQEGVASGDVVVKVWDSLAQKNRMVRRDEKKEDERSGDALRGYMVVGKMTVDNDMSVYFLNNKKKRGRGGNIDSYFDSIDRLKEAHFYKLSREEELNKTNADYKKLVSARQIENFLAEREAPIRQAYKARLEELRVKHTEEGKVVLSDGTELWVTEESDAQELMGDGMSPELADNILRANYGVGVQGNLQMAHVHGAREQQSIAMLGEFSHKKKRYIVLDVIKAGQDPSNTEVQVGSELYRAAWKALNKVQSITPIGENNFTDDFSTETFIPGEGSGKYGVDKAFNTYEQLIEILKYIEPLKFGRDSANGGSWAVNDLFNIADYLNGKYSTEDIAKSLGLNSNATQEEIDESIENYLDSTVQRIYYLAAVRGYKTAEKVAETKEASINIIRPYVKKPWVVDKDLKNYEGKEEDSGQEPGYYVDEVTREPTEKEKKLLEFRQEQWSNLLGRLTGKQSKDSFRGTLVLAHTRNNEQGKLTEFSKSEDFKGKRYDEDGWKPGGTFGKDGVYLAEEDNQWNKDEDLKWQYAGFDSTTYNVEVWFRNALVITPETIKEIVKKIHPSHKIERPWRTFSEQFDREKMQYRVQRVTEESKKNFQTLVPQVEVIGTEIAAWAKDNGHDGIIVRGFDSYLENLEKQADISEETYQKKKKELEGTVYNVGKFSREDFEGMEQETFKEIWFEDIGVADEVGQDQVFYFYPERAKVTTEPVTVNKSKHESKFVDEEDKILPDEEIVASFREDLEPIFKMPSDYKSANPIEFDESAFREVKEIQIPTTEGMRRSLKDINTQANLINTPSFIKQAKKDLAKKGYRNLTPRQRRIFKNPEVVHVSLPEDVLLDVKTKIKKHLTRLAGEKLILRDLVSDTSKPPPVGRARNIIRNRLGIEQLTRRDDKKIPSQGAGPGVNSLQTTTSENGTLSEALHDDFGKDIRDAMVTAGFSEEAINDFFEKAEWGIESNIDSPDALDREIYLSADRTERLKADKKTPYVNGFSGSTTGKSIRRYVDQMWDTLGRKYISEEDMSKWTRMVDHMNTIWVPDSYYFITIKRPKKRSEEVKTAQQKEDDDTTKSYEKHKLEKSIEENQKSIKEYDKGIDDIQKDRANTNAKMRKSRVEDYERAKKQAQEDILQAQKSLQEIEFIDKDFGFTDKQLSDIRDEENKQAELNDAIAQAEAFLNKNKKTHPLYKKVEEKLERDRVALSDSIFAKDSIQPQRLEKEQSDTWEKVREDVVENGLLLTEYAQHIREFFISGFDFNLPYLDDKSYVRTESAKESRMINATDVLDASAVQSNQVPTEGSVVDEIFQSDDRVISDTEPGTYGDDMEVLQEVSERNNTSATNEFDEKLDNDQYQTMDKRVPFRNMHSPVTGEIENGMPLVTDESSALAADRLARQKLANSVRSGVNPLKALGLKKELADNRLAIKEFLDSKFSESTPFSTRAFVERVIEILSENPNFRDSKAIRDIAMKISGSKALDGVSIQIIPWKEYSRIASANENGYSAATFIPRDNIIYVSDVFGDVDGTAMENLVSSIIHEAIHVPTKMLLDVGYAYHTGDSRAKSLLPDHIAGKEMGEIYGQINDVLLPMLRKKAGFNHFYALSSPDEFLSELGSDATFRDFLRNQVLTREERKSLGIKKGFIKTAWDWIVDLIAKLLGMGSVQSPELLRHTTKQLNRIIDLADGLSLMGSRIHDVNVRGIEKLNIFGGQNSKVFADKKSEYNTFSYEGKERFYIDDSKVAINYEKLREAFPALFSTNMKEARELGASSSQELLLPDVLDHPELYNAYPLLRAVKVVQPSKHSAGGSYSISRLAPDPGMIEPADEYYSKQEESDNPDIGELNFGSRFRMQSVAENYGIPVEMMIKSVLIHEVQHAVDDIEGVVGSSAPAVHRLLSGLLRNLKTEETTTLGRMASDVEGLKDIVRAAIENSTLKGVRKDLVKIHQFLETSQFVFENAKVSFEVRNQPLPFDEILTSFTISSEALPKIQLSQAQQKLDEENRRTDQPPLGYRNPNTTPLFGDYGFDLIQTIYLFNSGEISSRLQQQFLDGIHTDTKPSYAGVGPIKWSDGKVPTKSGKRDISLKLTNQAAEDTLGFLSEKSWNIPSYKGLIALSNALTPEISRQYAERQYASGPKGTPAGQLKTVIDEWITWQQSSSDSSNFEGQKAAPRPDDGARVYHEAQSGGLNELVAGLTLAYREVADILPPETTLEEFINKYGKLSLKWSNRGEAAVTKALEIQKKLLKPFEVDSSRVRLTDAGRNSVARSYGIRAAVAFLEATREAARSRKSESVTNLEKYQEKLNEASNIFNRVAERKLNSNEELVDSVVKKMRNMTHQRIEEYAKNLPGANLSQADIKYIQEISPDAVLSAMESMIDIENFESMTRDEMNNAILNMGSSVFSNGSVKSSLARVALILSIKNNKDVMFLFRLARNKLTEEQDEFYDAVVKVAKTTDADELMVLENGFKNKVKTVFSSIIKARLDQIRLTEQVAVEKNNIKLNEAIDDVLKYRSDKFRYAMGELENFDIRDGVKIKIAYKNDYTDQNEEWKIGTHEVEFRNGELKNRKKFIKVNAKTLEFLRTEKAKYETEPWWDLMREQAEMALSLPVTQQWSAVRRSAWMAGLESVNQRFSRLGYSGKRLAGMTARTVAIYRDLISQAQYHAKEFNYAYENVLSSLNIDGGKFYTGMYQDIFWFFDNRPEYAGNEEAAFKAMWKHVRRQSNVPDKSLLNDRAKKAVRTLVEKTITARDYEAKVNRDLGNRVKDDEISVQSYLDGEKSVDLYRMPLDMGYATLPRAVNDSKITSLINYMTNSDRGQSIWSGDRNAMPAFYEIEELIKDGQTQEAGKEIQKLFDDEITTRFLDPFMGSLNRKSLFYGPQDKEGWGAEMGNTYVMERWDSSNGNIVKFMDSIFNDYPQRADGALGKWYLSMLKQIHGRFLELKKVDGQIRSKAEGETRETEALKHVPRSLDARQVESRLPKDFFLYDMYDETSTSIRMAMFAGASVFGRDGAKATQAYKQGRDRLKDQYDLFATVISEVTGQKPDKPAGNYSKKIKREAYSVLRKMGHSNAKEKFSELHNDAVAYGELRTVFQHLRKYYGSNNEAGPYKDARFLLELLGTQSLAVLNNPKSSFWQGMSLFEFPLAFRGANKMAAKGTAKALSNFFNQTFGGMAEAMGVQLDRVGNYADNLNNTHFKMAEMSLPLRKFWTQVGNGAELTDKTNPKKYLRMLKAIAMHHKARGTRAPVDMMSLVTGAFPYVNNVVNHSVGVGALHVYEDLVLKVAKHIESNGLSSDKFEEITAEELGMGDSSFEWFIGEKDGYNNSNNMLVEAGAPSITRLAFDFVERKRLNPKTEVIQYETGLLINQVAMNNISGEGFNSKPAWLYTNPALKYFGFFLGWPLGKVARDNRFIFRGDQDSVNSYAAFLKYLGLVSAIYLPTGLSFAFLVDWYDEEVLGKPNSLPPITPWAALPVVGPLLAMDDPNFSLYGLTSRMAKAGTPYGMGFDLMNSIMAKGDPYSAAREFSLDSRIFAFSMLKNIYDAMGNWMHQGEFDWANVGRPLTYAMGGNSIIQMTDATNQFFQFDNEEARVAEYIGVRNYIKSTAYLMGMPLRAPSKGFGRPSPVSINVRQMERAAYAGDAADFSKQYNEAIEMAREEIANLGRKDTPEALVRSRFKTRSLRTGATRGRIGDEDWAALLEILPDDARAKVLRYEANHEYFLNEISLAVPSRPRSLTQREIRAQIALGL